MKFLEKNLVLPENIAAIKEVLPFNKTVQIIIKEELVTIGFDIADKIYAEGI